MSDPDNLKLNPALGTPIIRLIKYILILILYLLIASLTLNIAKAEAPTEELPEVTPEQLVEFYFDNSDVMLAIAQCESEQEQFKPDGTTVHSHTNDWGYFQINATHWDKEAKRLGLDYKGSTVDNILMAKHILKVQGITAWATYNNGCYKKHL